MTIDELTCVIKNVLHTHAFWLTLPCDAAVRTGSRRFNLKFGHIRLGRRQAAAAVRCAIVQIQSEISQHIAGYIYSAKPYS